MSEEKITVSWDDLNTRKVDTRLKEQDALARNREYARMNESSLPAGGNAQPSLLARIWRNSIFALALFGLTGGVVAWACGASLKVEASLKQRATELKQEVEKLDTRMRSSGRWTDEEILRAVTQLIDEGKRKNDYFAAQFDTAQEDAAAQLVATTPAEKTIRDKTIQAAADEKQRKLDSIEDRDNRRARISNILAYGASGVMIALFLAIALPLTERNLPAVIINGSVGAALGLVGGVIVSLFIGHLQYFILNSLQNWRVDTRDYLARVVVWGVMGLFLTIAPGVVMRNWKKFFIGLFGGLFGGLLGGVLYDPVVSNTGKERLAELIALAAIGLVAGTVTGLIENVAKTGWVRVVQGLIAGKQFILYRNPTYLGSGPDCQIYLFKDAKVGRRHAAIHIVPGGFELEDLPMGAATMVNGQTVARARLRSGDRIQIGSTALVFQEKTSS